MSPGSLARVRFLRSLTAGSISTYLASRLISQHYLAPNPSVIEVCPERVAICRIDPRHQLLECAPQPRHRTKSLANDLASAHRTTQPDPANQKITQYEKH